LHLTEVGSLQFFEPDLLRFPCLGLALEAARAGGSAPAVLSAANEIAVQAFLRDEIAMAEIAPVIRETLAAHGPLAHPTLEQIVAADAWARDMAQHVMRRQKGVLV
jgi:1-deoxy-D-xylulose-5-phosphate reductoisomerase